MSFTLKRIAGDLKLIHTSDMNGKEYFFESDTADPKKMTVAIVGPADSCYESCLLYFYIECPETYPIKPPVFKFWTPIGIRFHPNMYADGKVCLTMLNTWHDRSVSGWTSATTMEAIFTTIRSMLTNNPLSEEPGQHYKLTDPVGLAYHIAAKCYSLSNTFSYFSAENKKTIPEHLYSVMGTHFTNSIDTYKNTIKSLEEHNGKSYTYYHGNITVSTADLTTKMQKVIEHLQTG